MPDFARARVSPVPERACIDCGRALNVRAAARNTVRCRRCTLGRVRPVPSTEHQRAAGRASGRQRGELVRLAQLARDAGLDQVA